MHVEYTLVQTYPCNVEAEVYLLYMNTYRLLKGNTTEITFLTKALDDTCGKKIRIFLQVKLSLSL